MIVSYYFSSPEGDVPADDATLARPFVVRPLETHAFMVLKDYFDAVKGFLLREDGQPLALLLSRLWNREVGIDDPEKIIVRYEKYGTLYQIASAEVLAEDQKAVLAVTAAMSSSARGTLENEFTLLQELNRRIQPSYLPTVYQKGEITVQGAAGSEIILITLSEWFEGFHEWHFSKDKEGREGIVIWDMGGGFRFASPHEAHEIIRQASMILTLHYGLDDYMHISPWHHGAGDFIVKTVGEVVEVRLVTVRGYEPIAPEFRGKKARPADALFQFFLNMSIKMRLDKQEGMGEPFWAPAAVVDALVKGFFQALKIKESEAERRKITADEFARYLDSMSEDWLEAILFANLSDYRFYDQSDAAFIEKHVGEHAKELRQAISKFLSE